MGKLGGEAGWALVAQFAVWAVLVVVLPEVFDHYSGLGKRPALLAIETLIAEAGMEALDKVVLPGTTRLDADRADALLGEPALDDMGDRLRAMVGTQILWPGGAEPPLQARPLAAIVPPTDSRRVDRSGAEREKAHRPRPMPSRNPRRSVLATE